MGFWWGSGRVLVGMVGSWKLVGWVVEGLVDLGKEWWCCVGVGELMKTVIGWRNDYNEYTDAVAPETLWDGGILDYKI